MRVNCFSRGRRVVLQPQSTLVLSGSNDQKPANTLWASPNQGHPAHWRDEQLGLTTLLSTAISLPFLVIFQGIRGNQQQPFMFLLGSFQQKRVCYMWGGSPIHLGAVWSRLSAHRRSLSHLPARPWQRLGPRPLATEISPK